MYPYLNATSPWLADGPPFNNSLVWKSHMQARIDSSSGYTQGLLSGYVTLSTTQEISGKKTFNVGTNTDGFRLEMQTSPSNEHVIIGLDAIYQNTNKMKFDFYNSQLYVKELFIPTSAPLYISGNPANNNYVWKKWVVDNFQPITTDPFVSKTIIVDPSYPDYVLLKIYRNLEQALADVTANTPEPLADTNVYTILIKQPVDTSEYVLAAPFEVPDWVNIIGEGQVRIYGQLTRGGTESIITSKLQNLIFISESSSHAVDRFEVVDCIFENTTLGDIVLTKSKIRNSGFYALNGTVISNNDNKIIGCFGNYNVTWRANDKVYDYNYIAGDEY
jgi:hypothetical protein